MTNLQKLESNQLSAVQASQQLNRAITLVREARTFHDILEIEDQTAMTDAFLRTHQAAEAMGAQIDGLRDQLKILQSESMIRKAQLLSALEDKERAALAKKHHIPKVEVARAVLVGAMPAKTVQAFVQVQRKKGVETSLKDLVPVAKLQTSDERRQVLAKLGGADGARTIKQAVDRLKPVQAWHPSAPTPIAPTEPTIDLQASYEAGVVTGKCRDILQAAHELVKAAVAYQNAFRTGRTTQTKRDFDSARKTLSEKCAKL